MADSFGLSHKRKEAIPVIISFLFFKIVFERVRGPPPPGIGLFILPLETVL